MRTLKPVRAANKVEQAVHAVRDYIMDGDLKPGQKLPTETEMAKRIGVSKFSMREALRVLEAQGLIEITQGRRTRVSGPSARPSTEILSLALRRSKSSLLDLAEARESLETAIVRLAALRADIAHLDIMRKTIEDIDRNRGDLELCVQKDLEFHNALVRATGNLVFEWMLAPLAELLRESRRKTILNAGVDRVLDGHRSILEAVADRNPDKAGESMRVHLSMAREDLKKSRG
jgi:GntR family transcriptional regulator, transcriptional repressor for pyruvate dehydrogenase complex